ncbi:hypothetical protein MMC13_005716 [Lambiella insularis]|nr:hypothetical protein [Lambiella insularis]
MSAEDVPAAAGTAAGTSAPRPAKTHSCVLCSQRKVKCNKLDPCSNCSRVRVPCVYRAPAPPRRRRKQTTEGALLSRLQRAEELLNSYGARINGSEQDRPESVTSGDSPAAVHTPSDVESKMQQTRLSNSEKGRLIVKDGNSRYFENNLWKNLSDEFHDPKEIFHASSDDGDEPEGPNQNASYPNQHHAGDLIFGLSASTSDLRALHPQPMIIYRLWQAFLENVNPLSKILHTPTVQGLILEGSANLEGINKALEALMFAIYTAAVNSMTSEDCLKLIGEAKPTVMERYARCTQHALTRAAFLKSSDLMVLQAFVLFLLAMRGSYDSHTMWILSGIAVRVGQRLGLHRDGASLGLPVFEVEMRRRLSWQIVSIDGRNAQVAGLGISTTGFWDTKIPLNVNDSDLHPNMRDAPVEHTGPTEMIFCLVRYTAGDYFRLSQMLGAFDGNWQNIKGGMPIADRDSRIDELEAILERKFIRYCDPVIPLHFLATGVARGFIYSMRIMAHLPRQQPDQGTSMPQKEKDLLFANSLKMIEYSNLAHSTNSMQRYLWHIGNHFQWHALIYVLGELRFRRVGEETDRAWLQIEEVFKNYSGIIANRTGDFHTAITRLAMRAWEARDAELRQRYPDLAQTQPPNFIAQLYSQNGTGRVASQQMETFNDYPTHGPRSIALKHGQNSTESASTVGISESNNSGLGSYFVSESTPMDLTPIDWAEWDTLVKDFESQEGDSWLKNV